MNNLPLEIYQIIVEYLAGRPKHRDQVYLWNCHRLISKQFKHAVESFFFSRFLRDDILRIEAITCYEKALSWDFHVAGCFEMKFDRLSSDENKAIFQGYDQEASAAFKAFTMDRPNPVLQYQFLQL